MSSVSSDYESSYYTESEAESDYVTHEDGQPTHFNHTLEVEDIIREHVNVTTQNALGLNHHYKAKLLVLRMQLEGLLSRCHNRLIEVEKSLDGLRSNLTPKPRPARPRHPGYICGQPFFKDHELYPGPHNEDYLYRKNVKKEFFPLDLFESTESLWTRKDKNMLKSTIETQAQEFLHREHDLREKMCNNSESAERIRKERMELNTLPSEEIWHKAQAYDGKYGRQKFTVDWLKISTSVMNGRHSAAACEGMWNNYLMPGLKRSMWNSEEESKLVEAVEAHKGHRWHLIAQQVSERSEYQCFVHYQTNFSELVQSKKMPWTQEEDELLLRLVDENRIGNNVIWNKIVERMPYRNKVQVYHRYKYTLLRPLRGAKFTEEEDCVITAYVQQYGDDFKFFPDDMLPGRTTKQVWARYKNTLRFVNKHVGWNLEEDKRLMSYIAEHLTEEGPQKISWAHCSKFLGNHSRLSCRTRYYTIDRFLEKNPEATLEDVPRREKKKLSSKVTDKNWIKTIVDIKSAPKSGGRKAGEGPINLFQAGKPSTAEWSLYEQMKFCFRYKFGNGMAFDTKQNHIFTGTKMFLHLLEGVQTDCSGKSLPYSVYALNSKDKAVLKAVVQSPLDWPNVVSIMRPKITVSGDAMLFCRIPPNFNTVLGLRGVCLNACCEQTKQIFPELKVRKTGKLDEIMYDQAMAAFVERFRKIFHWTMLLMMLNIDDVTLENDEPLGNNGIASISNEKHTPMASSDPVISSFTQECAKPEIQLKPIENLIGGPVKMDKFIKVPTCSGSYPQQTVNCASFTPIVSESNENNVKLVTNITIIDPKDLPAVPEYECRSNVISDPPTPVGLHLDNPFEPTANVLTAVTARKPIIKQKPRGITARKPRKSNKKVTPSVDGQSKNCTEENGNLLAIQESKLLISNQKALVGQYRQQLENPFKPSENVPKAPAGTSKTDMYRKPRRAQASKPRKSTKKLAPCVDGQYENSTKQSAATLGPSYTDSNNCLEQNVTFTIMEVPQEMYLVHQQQQQQQQANLDYVAAHVTCPQEAPIQYNEKNIDGDNTNGNYSGQMVQHIASQCTKAYDEIDGAHALQQRSAELYVPKNVTTNITNVMEMLSTPIASIHPGISCSNITEVPCRTASACDDVIIVEKNHYLPDVGAMTIISNTRDGNQEMEGLIVTEREIQVPSGQIAFEGNYITYCFTDDHNPERVEQEMAELHKLNQTSLDTTTVAGESVCWHRTVSETKDTDTIARGREEPNADQLEDGSIVTSVELAPKHEAIVDSKAHLDLQLLSDMDGGQVTAVDIIRMLRTRHDCEDTDEENEIEDVTNG
uniref:snRNA-activating protein complex subunit 4 n=1 Tax=Anopheles christyi TaxID=43041 RepID=A0A182JT93_9DIPT